MKTCERCGASCEDGFKFCPHCGTGCAVDYSKDKTHNMTDQSLIAPFFSAALATLALIDASWKANVWASVAVFVFSWCLFVVGEVVADMTLREKKQKPVCVLAEVVAAVAIAWVISYLTNGDFFPVFRSW